MNNYNPSNANTLLTQIVSEDTFENLKNIYLSNMTKGRLYKTDVLIGNNHLSFKLRLTTDSQYLVQFWKLNFPTLSKNQQHGIDGEIIFLLPNRELEDNIKCHINNINLKNYKYYNRKINSVFAINDFYGNVKISYRGICANYALQKNVITLHSNAIHLNNKNIAIAGVSGSGKSTLSNLLNVKANSIWEDWGFVDSEKMTIYNPNELRYHMKVKTVKAIFPEFSDYENSYTEFYDESSKFYHDEARIMLNTRKCSTQNENEILRIHPNLDIIIILIADKNSCSYIKQVNPQEAMDIFSKPIYSKAYNGYVPYFNGSLILDDQLNNQHHKLFRNLFNNLESIILVNNDYKTFDTERLALLLEC